MIEGFSSSKHLHSLSASRPVWGMHRKHLQTSNLKAGHTHTHSQSLLLGGVCVFVFAWAHNDRPSESFWIQYDVKYVRPPGGRLRHGAEARGSSWQALMLLTHQHFSSLSLLYFPSLFISMLCLKEQNKKKEKDFTGAKPFKKKELVSTVRNVLLLLSPQVSELKVMQLPPACQAAVVLFRLCLHFFLIIKWQWAVSRIGSRVIIKAHSSIESGTIPAYLRDLLEFNTSGQTHIPTSPLHNQVPSWHALQQVEHTLNTAW